jgi:hypothetical protein
MIEFKAECGHAVRARDEDAGGTVRCSYCGRNAIVPSQGDHELDYLFSEVEQGPDEDEKSRRRRIRTERRASRKKKALHEVNPFWMVVRLSYVAGLVLVVWFVLKLFVLPMFDSQKRAQRMAGIPTISPPVAVAEKPSEGPVETPSASAQPVVGRGLLVSRGRGVLIASTPPGATWFALEESRAPASGRIQPVPGCITGHPPNDWAQLPDGKYVVDVVLAWNHPALADPDLPNHKNYTDFRRRLEPANPEQRRQLIEQYFIPDEARHVFADQTPEQIFLVRQYRGVEVRGRQGAAVRSLFLPRLGNADARSFRLEPLLNGFVAADARYGYDERQAKAEMSFYGVAQADQGALLEFLSRIGVAPYVMPDRRIRLFKVAVADGQISAPVIREASE